MSDIERLQRRLTREKKARVEAESLLEDKSRELFQTNESLRAINNDLDKLVVQRTKNLEEAKHQAEIANTAKSEFIANISHDIRTPLNAIIGLSEDLLEDKLDKKNKEYIEIIYNSAETLLSIVNQILDLSKIESAQLDLQNETFHLEPLLKTIVDMNSIAAKNKKLTLVTDISSDLPHLIISDPSRLHQIINNVFSNAIKYTQQGEITFTIHSEPIDERHSNLLINIRDTGEGISEEKLASIFDRYVQLKTATTSYDKGVGLGLSICKKLVTLMGGDIRVESEINRGSCFYITLPIEQVSQSRQENLEQNDDNENLLKGKNALVVDDTKTNLMIAKIMLDKIKIDYQLVDSGEKALDIVKQQGFDIILMDIQMPKLNGLEVTQLLRQQGYNAPIIAMTANAKESDKQACLDAGMTDYLAKPVKLSTLSQMLLKYLS